jgi:hypothetical protein
MYDNKKKEVSIVSLATANASLFLRGGLAFDVIAAVVTRGFGRRPLVLSVGAIGVVAHHATALDVAGAAEELVHFLKRDTFSLWDEEDDIADEQAVDAREHIEGVEPAVLEEEREELLHDGVGNVLRLPSHAYTLGPHVEREDFGAPDPGDGAPGWLVEEDEEEQEEHDCHSDWV